MPANRPQRRLELLKDVVQRKRALGDRLGEAVALANLGLAHEALGDRSAAIDSLEHSLAISRPSGYALSAARSATSLGQLREQAGDLQEAEARYAEAVELIESIRVGVPRTDAYMLGFARQQGTAYERLIDLLVARGMGDAAFDLVQRAKSRALLDLLGTT